MKRTATPVARLMLPFAVMAAPASAQEDVDCSDPQNTVEMRFCASQDFEEADGALNAAYRELT